MAKNFSDLLDVLYAGLAPTETLAKIGAEMNKPDGFALIEALRYRIKLRHLALRKLARNFNRAMEARLNAAGISVF